MNFGPNSDYVWSTQALTWNETSFAEPEAQFLWELLPHRLQAIARDEMSAGNVPLSMQLDRRTFVPLMSFRAPPLVPIDTSSDVLVHTKYAAGNYCYDGTHCTYELLNPTSFLAFEDPTYNYDAEFA
jgi:hypothetical protein